jgi:periplasmic protein TonB
MISSTAQRQHIPVSVKPTFLLPEREKNWWPMSFAVAIGAHLLILLAGGYAWTHQPNYGIQGSTASLEVYMVAARPEVSQKISPKKSMRITAEAPERETEMMILKSKSVEKSLLKEKQKNISESKKVSLKGDGSSAEPGKDSTTLFSQGSSEIQGKSGKYQNPAPIYPSTAIQHGWEGVVFLRVLVEANGKPSQIVIQKKSAHKILDEAALKAVRKWQFEPASIGDVAVSNWIVIPIRFALENKP